MDKPCNLFLIAAFLTLGSAASFAWSADGSGKASLSGSTDAGWTAVHSEVGYTSSRTAQSLGMRNAALLQSSTPSPSAILPVSVQGDTFPDTEYLTPDAILPPRNPKVSITGGAAAKQSRSEDSSWNVNYPRSSTKGAEPMSMDQGPLDGLGLEPMPEEIATPLPSDLQEPTPIPAKSGSAFNPNLSEPVIPGADESLNRLREESANDTRFSTASPKEEIREIGGGLDVTKLQAPRLSAENPVQSGQKGKGSGLKLSETKIHYSGRVGRLYITGVRNEDGSMKGNPYADGNPDYFPCIFPVNPYNDFRTRIAPPPCAFGEDGYGNPLQGPSGCFYGNGTYYDEGGYYMNNGTYEIMYEDRYQNEGENAIYRGQMADGCCSPCMETCSEYYECGGCYTGCSPGWSPCCFGSCGCSLFQTSVFEAGVSALRDPFCSPNGGNCGYNLALNWSSPNPILCGINAQVGGRYIGMGKTDYYDGRSVNRLKREEFYGTMGLFYRTNESPLSFGVVYDYMNDSQCWKYSLSQLRGEAGLRVFENTTFGARGASALRDAKLSAWMDEENSFDWTIGVNSYCAAFIRQKFSIGSEGMIFAGSTKDKEGIFGVELETPITRHSSLRGDFTCIFDRNDVKNGEGNAWGMNLAWVVYLGGSSHAGISDTNRPMFDVANVSSFFLR